MNSRFKKKKKTCFAGYWSNWFPSRQLVVPDFFAGSVFCNWAAVGNTTYERIGVQAHVSNLVRGRMVDATRGQGSDMALYSGFTTGASKSNTVCSLYDPITWQVDCKCRPVSASSFDKMCPDMKAERDDMSVLGQLAVCTVCYVWSG